MKKQWYRFIGILLAVCLLLSGCYMEDFVNCIYESFRPYAVSTFEEMTYQRPDPAALQSAADAACLAGQGDDADACLDAIFAYYDLYDRFSTAHTLAYIHYSCDMTDIYWEQEYTYCAEHRPLLDTSLEALYSTLAGSDLRQELEERYFGEDFFAYYDREFIWDEDMLTLLEEEVQLKNRYYELSEEAGQTEQYSEHYFTQYTQPLTELLSQLADVRYRIAAEAGYDNYLNFAYDYYYSRSYSPAQATNYLLSLQGSVAPLYSRLADSDIWDEVSTYCSSTETFEYVRQATKTMGGAVSEAFTQLESGQLYHISYGEHKNPTSFETYLWNYGTPFVFINPYMDQSDKLTFAHEFGHFANDYVCGGSAASTDVAEVHSQGFEYLSLCYSPDSQLLTRYALSESLCIYAEQAAYALFEHQLYSLPQQELTAENITALYADVCQSFGFDSYEWDQRDLITIPHFYTEPLYIMSYVVSNDVALQLYQQELETPGSGLSLYQQCLSAQDADIGSFIAAYKLKDPFSADRLEAVQSIFQEALFSQ